MGYNNMGWAKYKLEDIEGAIADYTKAIELDPELELAYTNRGIAKAKLGDIEGAIADYTKAIELDPNNTLSTNNLKSLQQKIKY